MLVNMFYMYVQAQIKSQSITSSNIYAVFGAIFAVILAVESYYLSNNTSAELMTRYAYIVEVFSSFSIALATRFLLLLVLKSIRWTVAFWTSIFMFFARWTIWCRPVRRYFRGSLKKMSGYITVKSAAYFLAITYFSAFVYLFWIEKPKMSSTMSISESFSLAVIAVVVSFSTAVLVIVFVVILPPTAAKAGKVKDELAAKIVAARKASDMTLLKELLRQKTARERENVGIRIDDLKEKSFLSRVHCIQLNSLILLYFPAILYSCSTWLFAYAMLYQGYYF